MTYKISLDRDTPDFVEIVHKTNYAGMGSVDRMLLRSRTADHLLKLLTIRKERLMRDRWLDPKTSILSTRDYNEFVHWIIRVQGTIYHPDTPFSDYVTRKGRKSFTGKKLQQLEKLRKQSFKLLGTKVYDYGLDDFLAGPEKSQ